MTQLSNEGYEVNASSKRGGTYLNKKLYTDNKELIKDANVVFLAVKPQIISSVLAEIKNEIEGKIIISVAVSLNINYYENVLGKEKESKIVRTMPTIAVKQGQGVIAYKCNNNITEEDKKLVEEILTSLGKIFEIKEELFDAVVGISGSAIAFLMKIFDAFIKEGIKQGLSPKEANEMFFATVKGASTMMQLDKDNNSGLINSEKLINSVASKGGTTEQGLAEMEEQGLTKIIQGTIAKTINKCKSLSEDLNNN